MTAAISAAFWMNLQRIDDLRRFEQEIGDDVVRIPASCGRQCGWRNSGA
jgi:hypothetical protein